MGNNPYRSGEDVLNVVVSMTTIPSRIGKMQAMVQSIRGQTRKPDMFILWLPEKCEKEGCGYDVPSWIRQDVQMAVMPAMRDWGPATKIIPLLTMSWSPRTLLVTVDDDVIYDSHLLEELEKASESGKFPDSALGFVGVKDKNYVHAEDVRNQGKEGIEVDVIGGYRGVAYRRDLLDDSLEKDALELTREGPFVLDDHLISWNLKRRAKKLVVVRTMSSGEGRLNFRFLNLANGIYDDGANREKVDDSMRRIRAYYDDRGWTRVA
jgi:hypothetical protein